MKQRTQTGVGVHCRQSQVITEYMENTLPTDVDIWSIDNLYILYTQPHNFNILFQRLQTC